MMKMTQISKNDQKASRMQRDYLRTGVVWPPYNAFLGQHQLSNPPDARALQKVQAARYFRLPDRDFKELILKLLVP